MGEPRQVVAEWLSAVQQKRVDDVLACFEPNGRWQNVPHDPAIGHDAIRSMLSPILDRSSKVVWDIITEAYAPNRAWLERIDRFWIDDVEYAVRCNGVLEFHHDTGLITELRDYVDLGEWRSRLAAVTFPNPTDS